MKNYARVFVIASVAVFILGACGEPNSTVDTVSEPRLVRTMTVSQAGELRRREFPGLIDAAQKADLSFRVAGSLQAVNVAEGDEIAKGQLVARLDPEDFETRLVSVQADFERAKADFERAEGLVGEGFISQADFDKLNAQYSNAQSQLNAAEKDLDNTGLVAPFDGVVARRHVENFEEVNAKQPVITLHDLTTLQVKVDIPESVMIRVQPDADERQVYATFDAMPGQEFPLTLLEVSSEPDPASNTYEVTFTMPAIEDRVILPGMTVKVIVEAQHSLETTGGVIVPPSAVMEDQDGRFVWIAEPTGDDTAVIHRRPVETGLLTEQGLVVSGGIEVGDRVVTAGMSRLVEGQVVRISTQDTP